jgi:hypothetical protein
MLAKYKYLYNTSLDINGTSTNRRCSQKTSKMADRRQLLLDLNALENNQDDTGQLITMQNVRDGVVAAGTFAGYCWEIYSFLCFCRSHQQSYLTVEGQLAVESLQRLDGEKQRAFRSRVRPLLQQLLRSAEETPIINIHLITPRRYMEYVLTIRHHRTGKYLSQSGYGNRRSALFHLFRLHNRVGFNDSFRLELTNQYKGLFREMARRANDATVEEGSVAGTTVALFSRTDESKEPLSTDLLVAIAGWLLSYNTCDGVFAHCFLLLTWNLACRSNNTACIKLSDMVWSTSFDCFHIFFAHSKTDQTGDESKYPRHIYANPNLPVVCPVTSLAMYFSTCFNSQQLSPHCLLFSGNLQEIRFSKILMKLLREHEDEVRSMGFEVRNLGTHSIRKGASSYLTSLPGGPSAAATSIRGGWSMGNVKDRYFKYFEAGDQFVGRCIALNPVLSESLASSPPFFSAAPGSEDDVWLTELCHFQFPALRLIDGFGKLTRMCLASLLYHRSWIFDTFVTNHVVRVASYSLRDENVITKINSSSFLKVTYPWNDNEHSFSGIPPFSAVLQKLTRIEYCQSNLVSNFENKVIEAMRLYGLHSDRQSEERVRALFAELRTDITALSRELRVVGVAGAVEEVSTVRSTRVEAFRPHYYGNKYHRVPVDWRFPRCGVQDLWRQWWIGDTVRQVPPLRFLDTADISHLDKVRLDETELHGRTGQFGKNRRQSKKIMCDMKFLMTYIKQQLEGKGVTIGNTITVEAVDQMFAAISEKFDLGPRDMQKQWLTVVRDLRKKNTTN